MYTSSGLIADSLRGKDRYDMDDDDDFDDEEN